MALLPASELASLSPSSYMCASCSLPLVPAPPTRYRDLPSEHWEELIDAWMCHPEGQTLAKTGMHGSDGNGKGSSFGFWPTRDEALVGGSYILFDAQAVAGGNIKCVGAQEVSAHSWVSFLSLRVFFRTFKKTDVVLPPTYAFSRLEALGGFEVAERGSGRYNTSKSDLASLKQPSIRRVVCWGLHKRTHFITLFILACIVDLWTDKDQTFSAVEILAWRTVYVVRSWAGNMTGHRRTARSHGCIGCSSMLFGQSVLHHSEWSRSQQASRSELAHRVPRIPMSAFVLHDMLEHVQAHATYRFVLSDEEDERPRLLVNSHSWLLDAGELT